MNQLTRTFLRSRTAYTPTSIRTSVDQEHVLKYRGVAYAPRKPIPGMPGERGLQFKGSTY